MRRCSLFGVSAVIVAGTGLAAPVTALPSEFPAERSAAAALPPEFSGTVSMTYDVEYIQGGGSSNTVAGAAAFQITQGNTADLQNAVLLGRVTYLDHARIFDPAGEPGPVCSETYTTPSQSRYDTARLELSNPEILAAETGNPWETVFLPRVSGVAESSCGGGQAGFTYAIDFDLVLQNLDITLDGPIASTVSAPRNSRLIGTQRWDAATPEVAQYMCATPDASECYSRFQFSVSYDLTRISPENRASQYPVLKVKNDAKGRDVVILRTRPARPNVEVVLFVVDGFVRNFGKGGITNSKGVYKVVLKDKQRRKKRTFLAFVSPTRTGHPAYSPARSIR